jgi:tRNA(Ile)-lysidine synthase
LKNDRAPEVKVLDFIRKEGLIIPGQTVVVAVSGGADSVCLLYVLAGLQEQLPIRLHVAHLDHRLRGAASAADARYVAGLAHRLGLPATVASRDVQACRREHRLSLEEAAREVRYAFLGEVAAATGAGAVAVGHTADDHIETILMHIIRGSGLGGLRGLRPVSRRICGGRETTILRPLLVLSREETAPYCRRRRLRPRQDASNLSMEPLRNRVRLHLLPELRKYNPRIDDSLARLAQLAADDLDFIEAEADRRRPDIEGEERGLVALDREKLAALPPSLQRHLLRAAVASRLGGLKDIEAGHIEDMLEALEKPAGKVVELPGGLTFIVEHDRFLLADAGISYCPFPVLRGEAALNVPGQTVLPGWDVRAEIISPAAGMVSSSDEFVANMDLAAAGGRLTVRARRPGDRFRPLGLGAAKDLTDFMIDAHVPRTWRRRVPVVVSPGGIIWLVGWRIDERVMVTENTTRVLRLTFRPA